MPRPFWMAAYYASWLLFGAGGALFNLACLVALALPRRWRPARIARRVLRGLFVFWAAWFRFIRVVRIAAAPFPAATCGTIYVANHPTLIDGTLLLARLPDALVVVKPSLLRNPVLGPAVALCRFVASNAGIDLVREVAERVASGESLLVFPEGTRTAEGTVLGAFKPGFALIAERARAPVQLLVIRASRGLVPRGRPWWLPPQVLPASWEVSVDRRWDYRPGRTVAALSEEIEAHLRARLAAPPA